MTVIFTILHENALYRTNLAKNYSWDIKTISNIGINEYKVYRPRNFYEISLPINYFEKRTFTCNAKLYNFCKQEYSQQTATLKSVTYYHTQLAPSNNQLYRLKAIEYIDKNKKLLEIDTSLIHPNAQSEISKNSNKL